MQNVPTYNNSYDIILLSTFLAKNNLFNRLVNFFKFNESFIILFYKDFCR